MPATRQSSHLERPMPAPAANASGCVLPVEEWGQLTAYELAVIFPSLSGPGGVL